MSASSSNAADALARARLVLRTMESRTGLQSSPTLTRPTSIDPSSYTPRQLLPTHSSIARSPEPLTVADAAPRLSTQRTASTLATRPSAMLEASSSVRAERVVSTLAMRPSAMLDASSSIRAQRASLSPNMAPQDTLLQAFGGASLQRTPSHSVTDAQRRASAEARASAHMMYPSPAGARSEAALSRTGQPDVIGTSGVVDDVRTDARHHASMLLAEGRAPAGSYAASDRAAAAAAGVLLCKLVTD